eukprot:c10815_g2_i1.p1 GENE.c10815_g2_i1~~c10815_g2_i1.p1  ORF type:complete len:582 (+),score=192.33 c10815_g2_i1:33-1748(+)
MSVTFKLVLKKNDDVAAEPEIRRVTLASNSPNQDVSLDNLRAHAKRLFKLRDDIVWYFKWQDEEGDLVTITEQYEFEDVLQTKVLAFDGGIVRLNIFVESQEPQPIQIRVIPFHHPFQQHLHHFCNKHTSRVAPVPTQTPTPAPRPSHEYEALCDVTNTRLRMQEGNWYHQPGTSTDVCVEEFSMLSTADQQWFVQVTKPSDLGDDQARYRIEQKCQDSSTAATAARLPFKCNPRHCRKDGPFAQAPAAGQKPAGCGLFGDQIDIGEELRQLMHVGWCDVTGSMLIAGRGWYHKRNTTNDLCEELFNKLEACEKQQFVRVDKPEDLGADQQRYNVVNKAGGVFDHVMQEIHRASEVAQKPQAPSPRDDNACSSSVSSSTPAAEPAALSAKKSMQIVSGPSIAAGSKVETGAHVIPVWEVENTGNVYWTDVRVKQQGNNDATANVLQVNSDGFEVPALAPGERGIVSVGFVVRDGVTDPSGQVVEAVFELVGVDGDGFGEPLSIKLHVMPSNHNINSSSELPPVANESGLVAMLGDMGFCDPRVCVRVLREHKGDVNAAALALLRAQSSHLE